MAHYVTCKLSEIIYGLEEKKMEYVRKRFRSKNQLERKKRASTSKCFCVKPKEKNIDSISFGHSVRIGTTPYAFKYRNKLMKSVKNRPGTGLPTIKTLFHNYLETAQEDQEDSLFREELDNKELIHLYDHQKNIIASRLMTFEHALTDALDMKILEKVNLMDMVVKCKSYLDVSEDEMKELFEISTKTILTLPEKDTQMANIVDDWSEILVSEIVKQFTRLSTSRMVIKS